MNAKTENITEPNVYDYIDLLQYIDALYEYRKRRFRKETWQNFGRDSGVGPALVQIAKGSRPFTLKKFKLFANFVNLDNDQSSYLQLLFDARFAKSESKRSEATQRISQFRDKLSSKQGANPLLENWLHLTVFEFLGLNDGQWTAKDVAKHLKSKPSLSSVKESLRVLEASGLAAQNNGVWSRLCTEYRTANEVSDAHIKQYHYELLDLAKRSLIELKNDERLHYALTVSLDESAREKLKTKLDELVDYALYLSDKSNKDSAILTQINFQKLDLTSDSSKDN